MKFTLPFKKHAKASVPKKFRINARRYWVILLCAFVLLLAIELVYFSLLFLHTGDRIDAPASPTLETNDVKIRRMETKLDAIEAAIKERVN
jgi:hypothetical protein